jgi:hypothetical protein
MSNRFQPGHVPFGAAAASMEARRQAELAKPVVVPLPQIIVSRFQLADVPARAPWLLKRLIEEWPHISEATFAGRIRVWIGSNQHYFARTPHAIALAVLQRHELDPLPFVEEVFLKTEGVQNEEGTAIYRDLCRWAKGHGAAKVIIDKHSDMSSTQIQKRLDALEDIEMSLSL